jgi:hypothetical protein
MIDTLCLQLLRWRHIATNSYETDNQKDRDVRVGDLLYLVLSMRKVILNLVQRLGWWCVMQVKLINLTINNKLLNKHLLPS